MSCIYIVIYAGAPLELPRMVVRRANRASQYTSRAEAWLAVRAAGLNPEHCECLTLDEAVKREGGQ